MSESKGSRKKGKETEPKTTVNNVSEKPSTEPEKPNVLATGLEDYGRWKTMFQDHKRDPNEKPFRRGRIWC